MKTSDDFFDALEDIGEIKNVKNTIIEFWGDDYPVTLLFSELGKSVVRNFERYTAHQMRKIFLLTEEIMENGNDSIKSYVATGFLESLASELKKMELNIEIYQFIGERSKKYMDIWNNL